LSTVYKSSNSPVNPREYIGTPDDLFGSRSWSELDPRLKQVLTWRFLDELPLSECAHRMGMHTREAVARIERRALRDIAQRLVTECMQRMALKGERWML
jgi:hypothetical protein